MAYGRNSSLKKVSSSFRPKPFRSYTTSKQSLAHLNDLEELGLETVLDLALEHVRDVGVLEVLLHVHDVGGAQVAALLVPGLGPVRNKL